MKNYSFVTNLNRIFDFDQLIENIKNIKGEWRNFKTPYGDNVSNSFQHPVIGSKSKEMHDNWKKWGYVDNDSIEYIQYFPGTHFDKSYSEKFGKLLNTLPLKCWISSIPPGKCIPWHYDIEKKEDEFIKLGTIERYTVFIDKPEIGKIFILNDEVFHLIEQGSVYKWHNWKEYHLGFNCSSSIKFLMHYIGIVKN